MGHNVSLLRGRRKSLRSFVKKSNTKGTLSHTFTISEVDEHTDLLNINTATEEELMTLPGVNREIARNIVGHRKAIGRYRKVEDLALVRGIGAHKLELMREEICVSTKRSQSCASSRAPSYDSIKSIDSKAASWSNKLINVNKASVFELQTIPGVTQEIAAAIVTQRKKSGRFKKIDDLLKVKQIDQMRLNNITRYLTVCDQEKDKSEPRPCLLTNGFPPLQTVNGHNYRPSEYTRISNGLTPSSMIDIFELLSTYSPRPIAGELFKFSRNGEPAIRICSWNLHEFSEEKARNLGVKEVVCRTILENCISLVAVQDIRDAIALEMICEELNKPTLRRIEEWKENSQNWNYCILDGCNTTIGFIYDSAGAGNIELVSLMESPVDTRNDCEAQIAHFLVGNINLQVVNMTIKTEANLQFLHEKITDLINEEEMVMLCIDFSNYDCVEDQFLRIGGLQPIFPAHTQTNFRTTRKDDNSRQVSNIMANSVVKQNLTGYKNVVTKGITHLAIPNGWSWGGPVSPYYPVWVELFLNTQSESTTL